MSEEIASSLVCVKCDGEPEPAKVIVVTEHGGRKRRFAASRFAMTDNGQLAIGEPIGDDPNLRIDPVAGLNAGRWADVAYEGAELADAITPKARRMQSALRQIAMADYEVTVEILQGIARSELHRTGWDEEDL